MRQVGIEENKAIVEVCDAIHLDPSAAIELGVTAKGKCHQFRVPIAPPQATETALEERNAGIHRCGRGQEQDTSAGLAIGVIRYAIRGKATLKPAVRRVVIPIRQTPAQQRLKTLPIGCQV